MKILADYHHSDLFESYQMMFTDRFGWEVYRPIGMEWFEQWFWSFERAYHGDAVAHQYLDFWDGDVDCGDHWERKDSTHPGRMLKMVTLEQARSRRWDIVISSLPDNDPGLYSLAKETGARFGVQIGNQGQQSDWNRADFGLVSSNLYGSPPKPHVFYHQEFSLEDFRWEYPPADKRSVASFVQCFAENPVPYAEFMALARTAPDIDWKVYGAYGSHPEDEYACGNLGTTPKVAEAMRATRVAWHSKSWSDGYGHVIHNLFAVGRPVFGRAAYYADKLAGPLWIEGVTSFDVDSYSQSGLLDIIERLLEDDEYHERVSRAAHDRFHEVVSFDEDAAKVRQLIEKIVS